MAKILSRDRNCTIFGLVMMLLPLCGPAIATQQEEPLPITPASSVHTYIVTHPETGQTLVVTGTIPPTETALDAIFSETIGYAGLPKGGVIVRKNKYKIIDSVLKFAR